jgi:hypothetical protein
MVYPSLYTPLSIPLPTLNQNDYGTPYHSFPLKKSPEVVGVEDPFEADMLYGA